MAGYTKLFGSILDSTVWESPMPTRIVWITMLAMADQDGIVEASVPGLAKRAAVERSDCEAALAAFLAPDPDSRSKDHEGRRIEVVDGGWRLLNFEKYRNKQSLEDRRARGAERQQRFRENRRNAKVTRVTECIANNDTISDQNRTKLRSDPDGEHAACQNQSQPRPFDGIEAVETFLSQNGAKRP